MRLTRSRPSLLAPLALVACCLAAACTGVITDPGDDTNGAPGSAGGSGKTSQAIGASSPLRRLTRVEYDNTVRDLLGDDSHPASAFPPDEKALGVAMGGTVSALLAERYQDAAESVASTAVSHLDQVLPCDPADIGQDACATQFIESFGKRAFRRPLTSDEKTRLANVYTNVKGSYDFETAVEVVISAVLQSPNFLYVVELEGDDKDPNKIPLTAFELASRLSYFLWSSMPDDALFAAADSGKLLDAEELEAQARRMLKDGRAADTVRAFHAQWLELEGLDTLSKDSAYYPSFDDALRASMRREVDELVEHVVLEDGRLDTLLTGAFSYADSNMASFYGVSAPSTPWGKVALDPSERAGILTLPALLATHAKPNQSSPILRGKFVREALLCQQLPPPPADLVIVPPDPDPNATTREVFKQHTSDPTCAGCHKLMDPIGFGFEHYDGIGKYRDMDGKFPVDASGEVLGSEDTDGAFDGVPQLAKRLAQSEQVRDCVARHWLRFALKRGEVDDESSLQLAEKSFAENDYDIRELMVAIVTTHGFRFRKNGDSTP